MFIDYTFQDWEATPEGDRLELIAKIIRSYKASEDFRRAGEADEYFRAGKTAISKKVVLQPHSVTLTDDAGQIKKCTQMQEIVGTRIFSNFFFLFVTQQNQYLLGNGVNVEDNASADFLSNGFDKAVEQIGEKALVHGVCWGYWNNDHLEVIPAYTDELSGFVTLVDERTSLPRLGIQFWQINQKRPLYVRLFEEDGLTEYKTTEKDKEKLEEYQPKRGYKQTWAEDAAGKTLLSSENYGLLPVVPFYASELKCSELTNSIKEKIDAYDIIFSDFGDNLAQANEIYWVFNNFGGRTSDIAETLALIKQLRAIANVSDGTSSSTVEAKSFEVPYEARKTALALLEKALYRDYMAMSMDELTGGSLTNVAIRVAQTNLDLKANRYEWQAFAFVQQILALAGIKTENITFKRQSISNVTETIQNIYLMRQDIDQRTALSLNPMILADDVEDIIRATQEEQAFTYKEQQSMAESAEEVFLNE